MADGPCELIALCLGFLGLVGASATTGMPMWKVTAFIQENIITMETRWEGLWMNCYRQANIRMQCKVYDSLLYLPAELQAARGLMCCSLALSFLGLMVALPGLRCMVSFRVQPRIKNLIVVVAGAMQIMAALCVFIPVSWTAHVIIQDFYNPLLLDAQRRELGEALYIGWVTGAVLLASGVIFLACRPSSDSYSSIYKPVYGTNSSALSQFLPMSTPVSMVGPFPQPPQPPSHGLPRRQPSGSIYSPVAVTPSGQPVVYTTQVPPQVPVMPNLVPPLQRHPSFQSSHSTGTNYTLRNSSMLYTPVTTGHAVNSYNPYTSTQPVYNTPVQFGYGYSRTNARSSDSHSSSGIHI